MVAALQQVRDREADGFLDFGVGGLARQDVIPPSTTSV
jgi:hypothetical protein